MLENNATRFGKIAILKPDHLGDMVLSSPAIRAVFQHFPNATLICDSACVGLAAHLFPAARILPIRYPHLQKDEKERTGDTPRLPGGPYDVVLSLRSDDLIDLNLLREAVRIAFSNRGGFTQHETSLQRTEVERLTGPYSRTKLFFGNKVPVFPSKPNILGLCVSAGFSANRWPHSHWLGLGRLLRDQGNRIVLIGGPQEADELHWLRGALDLSTNDVLIGNSNFASFLKAVSKIELLIATDSGTAHLCSMVIPVLSLFGPSPFRRFAPFGRHNKVLTFDLSCSPCPQFDQRYLNLCVSRECMNAITPPDVMNAIQNPEIFLRHPRLRLVAGVSHQSE